MPEHLIPVLTLDRGNEKVRKGEKKRNKVEHHGSRREVIRKRGRILEVNVYYYEISE